MSFLKVIAVFFVACLLTTNIQKLASAEPKLNNKLIKTIEHNIKMLLEQNKQKCVTFCLLFELFCFCFLIFFYFYTSCTTKPPTYTVTPTVPAPTIAETVSSTLHFQKLEFINKNLRRSWIRLSNRS